MLFYELVALIRWDNFQVLFYVLNITRRGVVSVLVIKGKNVVDIGTDELGHNLDMFGGLVVELEIILVLKDHSEAVSKSLGASAEVDAQVHRLNNSWQLVLEFCNTLEDFVALLFAD